MQKPVAYRLEEEVAVIQIDNPPVNALGFAVRQGLMSAMERAWADDAVRAVVIGSAGRLFCAGADISEFGQPMKDPLLPDLLKAIENSPKLTVVALDGAALGGGCELALVCHYRFALPKAKIGLPEVKLGLLPGAGGTQRLPRLAGAETALDMIVSGNPVDALRAAESGIVDRVHLGETDFYTAAVAYARELLAAEAPRRNCASLSVPAPPDGFFAAFREKKASQLAGFFAPERCIQAVEAATTLPLTEGLLRERALFLECMASPQSAAQRHMFFAERQAGHVPGVGKDTPRRSIQSVAVIGAGTMGGGIAMNFANAGIPTKILEVDGEKLARGLEVVHKNYGFSVKRGKLSEQQVEDCMGLIQGTLNYDDLADVDLVIEAVFEDMALKKSVFAELDRVCKPGCILATNTSTLDVDEIAASTTRPGDVVGLHFFSPANVMRLLEIVRARETRADVLATVVSLARTLRKVGVVVGVCFGFVGNRMLGPYLREAQRLLLEGAGPQQIDGVVEAFGMRMGPLAMTDLAGIDVGYLIRQATREQHAFDKSFGAIADRLYALGRYGQKSGRGFYLYEGRRRQDDPDLIGLIEGLAHDLGIVRRPISDQEVIERCFYPLINEGAKILEEGIATRSSDIDVTYCYGYGFPIHRGGPMHYADQVGPDKVYESLCRFRNQTGEYGQWWLQPASLLRELAEKGGKFADKR